jgi:hypothetical protein
MLSSVHSRRDCKAKRPPVQLSEFSGSILGVKGATSQNGAPHPAKLLDQLRYCIRVRCCIRVIHYNLPTERAYFYCARWYIRVMDPVPGW